jgi:hypothetical protein
MNVKQTIKCERTNCYRDALYMAEGRHLQADGTVDIERRASCEIHSREELPQNLTPLSLWKIIKWPDLRCDRQSKNTVVRRHDPQPYGKRLDERI